MEYLKDVKVIYDVKDRDRELMVKLL